MSTFFSKFPVLWVSKVGDLVAYFEIVKLEEIYFK